MLRVEAEKDDYKKKGQDEVAPWKATEAVLVSQANTDTLKNLKEAKKKAEVLLCLCVFERPHALRACPCALTMSLNVFFPLTLSYLAGDGARRR